jgi:hypothetical protein
MGDAVHKGDERERETADKEQKGFDTNQSLGQQTVDTVR